MSFCTLVIRKISQITSKGTCSWDVEVYDHSRVSNNIYSGNLHFSDDGSMCLFTIGDEKNSHLIQGYAEPTVVFDGISNGEIMVKKEYTDNLLGSVPVPQYRYLPLTESGDLHPITFKSRLTIGMYLSMEQ